MNWDLTILWTSFVEFNFLSFWVDLNFKIWSCFKNIKAMSRFQFFFVRIHTDLELLFFDWKIVILFWFLNIAQLFLDTSFDSYFFLSFCSHLVQGTRHLNFSETLALSHSASYSIVLQVKAMCTIKQPSWIDLTQQNWVNYFHGITAHQYLVLSNRYWISSLFFQN